MDRFKIVLCCSDRVDVYSHAPYHPARPPVTKEIEIIPTKYLSAYPSDDFVNQILSFERSWIGLRGHVLMG